MSKRYSPVHSSQLRLGDPRWRGDTRPPGACLLAWYRRPLGGAGASASEQRGAASGAGWLRGCARNAWCPIACCRFVQQELRRVDSRLGTFNYVSGTL